MILYKYSGDSGLRILENLRLKITPPNEFNDPFEITPFSRRFRPLAELLADAGKGSTFYRRVYSEMVQDGAFSGSFDEFIMGLPSALRKYHSGYRSLSREEVVRRDMSTVDVVSSKLGVLCLSKPRDDVPMWSYYANDHRGVVIGIDIVNIGGRLPGPSGFVKYRKHRVRHNPFAADSPQQRLRTIFTKSEAWRHEREFRRVFRLSDLIALSLGRSGRKAYFLDISCNSIREVILGCRIKPRFEKKIREEFTRRQKTFQHVQLYRCVRHPSKFELKIVPVT